MDEAQEPQAKSRRHHVSELELLVNLGVFTEDTVGADARQLARVNRSLREAVKFWWRKPFSRRDPLWRIHPPWLQNPWRTRVLDEVPAAGELTDWDLQLLKEACERSDSNVPHVLCVVAERGSVQALEDIWVKHAQDGVGGTCDVLASAASGGHVANMEWALSRGFGLSACAFESAAGHGHMEALQWLHQRGCEFQQEACLSAAAGGHLHVLQWIEDTITQLDPTYTDLAAARWGHVHILQWISDHNPFLIDRNAWDEAARAGQFGAMKWMMDMPERSFGIPNSLRLRQKYYKAAVQRGDMDGFLYFFDKLPRNDYLILCAVIFARLDMLKHLYQKGLPLFAGAWIRAAREGHLEMLRWLADNKCPINNSIGLVSAAARGHLHVVKWLLAHKELVAHVESGQKQQWLDKIHSAQDDGVDPRVAEWLCSPEGSRMVSIWLSI